MLTLGTINDTALYQLVAILVIAFALVMFALAKGVDWIVTKRGSH